MTGSDLDAALAKIADGSGEGIFVFAQTQDFDDWSVVQALLASAIAAIKARGDDLPYDVVSNNCIMIAHRVVAEMHSQWAKVSPGKPPPSLGIIWGDVPTDGDNRDEDWHCLILAFVNGVPYLAGAQDGQVMNQDAIATIKDVEYAVI